MVVAPNPIPFKNRLPLRLTSFIDADCPVGLHWFSFNPLWLKHHYRRFDADVRAPAPPSNELSPPPRFVPSLSPVHVERDVRPQRSIHSPDRAGKNKTTG